MDGSSVGTVVTLHSTSDNIFLFTIDYSQHMLYWMNSIYYSNSCYYTNYIETSNIHGSGRRIVYNESTLIGNCTNNSYYNNYSQAIDFFGGAIYTYSRDIFKAVVVNTPKIVTYDSVNWYMCNFTYYTALKVISPERQLQGNCYMYLPTRHAQISFIDIAHCWQVQTLVPSTMGAVLTFVFLVLIIQETTCAPVPMGHSFIKMDIAALVNNTVMYSA